MASNTRKKSPEKLNREYFKSLIATRASIGALFISWAGLFISLILLFWTWNIAKYSYKMNPLENGINNFIIFNILFMAICLAMISFRFSRNFLYKHQGFASILVASFSIMLTFELVFLCYLLTQADTNNEQWYGTSFSITVIAIFTSSYLGSLIYNICWLKNQLKAGFPVERANANYFAQASVFQSKSLWIIFGCTVLGAFLTGYYVKVYSLIGGVFLGAVYSRLTVEYTYAAYLLNTNKEYWINYGQEPKVPLSVMLKKRLKRSSTYVVMGIILILAIVEIENRYEERMHEVKNQTA